MSDIVEELRKRQTGRVLLSDPPKFEKDGLCQQAASEIEALRAENEKLRKALRPYADKYHWDIRHYDEVMPCGSLKAHDFYAAAKALGESGDELLS